MLSSFDIDHLKMLMYHFGAHKVVALLEASSERELLAWIDKTKVPTSEQVSRIADAYTQMSAKNR